MRAKTEAVTQHSPLPEAPRELIFGILLGCWYNKGKIVFRCEDGNYIAQAVSEAAAQTFVNEHNRKLYDIWRHWRLATGSGDETR